MYVSVCTRAVNEQATDLMCTKLQSNNARNIAESFGGISYYLRVEDCTRDDC